VSLFRGRVEINQTIFEFTILSGGKKKNLKHYILSLFFAFITLVTMKEYNVLSFFSPPQRE
jgi:hypothetical protein